MSVYRTILLAAATMAAGCVPPQKRVDPGAPTTRPDPVTPVAPAIAATQAQPAVGDAQETARRFFRIEVYRFNVPAGAVSESQDFWKPADETFLGFELHQALDRSGVRVGKAMTNDILPAMQPFPDVQIDRDNILGVGGKMELDLHKEWVSQTLFWYDPALGQFDGRDYARSQNLYVVGYHQLSRRPDHVAVEFAPAVRERRPMLSVTENGVSWRVPDTIFALGIRCELGPDECVIIAPSHVARTNGLVLGRAFLMDEGVAQRMERVLIIVPRVERIIREP